MKVEDACSSSSLAGTISLTRRSHIGGEAPPGVRLSQSYVELEDDYPQYFGFLRRRDVVTNIRGSAWSVWQGFSQGMSSEPFPSSFRTGVVDIRVGGGLPAEYVKDLLRQDPGVA